MFTPLGRIVVGVFTVTVLSTPLVAQGSAAWTACRMDSLATYNCAQYYSGTVSLTSELRGTNLRQTFSVVATVTAGRVVCRVSGTEVGEFEGPGMLAVEHSTNMNAGEYTINLWCPEAAGERPRRGSSPMIMVKDQRSSDFSAISGRDAHEHPDTDAANGLSGTETISWDLRRR